MPELDHLIYASPDVHQGVRYIEELTGATAVFGGPHVGLGTHNYLLTFDERTYFEIIGIDPEQPDPGHARPFGLDAIVEPKLAGYAIHPVGTESMDDVVAAMRLAGFDPGSIAEMSRRKPDGDLLTWSLTRGGDTGEAVDGALPFAIDWADGSSPANALPAMGALTTLEISHPDPVVRASATALSLRRTRITEGSASLTAVVQTPGGIVEIT